MSKKLRGAEAVRQAVEPLEGRWLLAAEFLVTSTADAGPGSLRQAIIAANDTPGADLIKFQIEGAERTIRPASALPTVTDPVTIDGTTQPGFAGTPLVILDGEVAGDLVNGLTITGGNSTVRGLVIQRFDDSGIKLLVNGGNVVVGNYIGTDAAGNAAMGNRINGVQVGGGSHDNVIGGFTAADRNIISGNGDNGIYLAGFGTNRSIIRGNYIGTNAAGTAAVPNGGRGIEAVGQNELTIGGAEAGAGNLISGNAQDGVALEVSTQARIQGNRIGTDLAGAAAIPNGGHGVTIQLSQSVTVGAAAAAARNIISGNAQAGVHINFGESNSVRGNYIGTDATGAVALPNGVGVHIDQSDRNTVGGTTAAARNVISGNAGDGVYIDGAIAGNANTLQANYIGVDASGVKTLANGGDGVHVHRSSDNVIGGTTAATRNIITGNDQAGVRISDNASRQDTNNRLIGNWIGLDSAGSPAPAASRQAAGVLIEGGASGNIVGGLTATSANVIGGNVLGVHITGEPAPTTPGENNVVRGNFIGVKADGTTPAGNTSHGVLIDGNAGRNQIGGVASGEANSIAFNGGDGVYVAAGSRITVRGNSIHSNTGLGIDLGADGVTANDPLDADSGPNALLNFPVINTAAGTPSGVNVSGAFSGAPEESFTLDFYASPAADATGHGEGRLYLGSASVATGVSGNATFNAALTRTMPAGYVVSASATDASGNTSEFSLTKGEGGGDQTPPTVDIVDVVPDPRGTGVENIIIIFSEAVSGFDLSDLRLVRDGTVLTLGSGQTLGGSDGVNFTLGGLMPLTSTPGAYTLTVLPGITPSPVTDLAGNAMVVGTDDIWTAVDALAITVTPTLIEGQTATLNGTIGLPPATAFTVQVDWGDGVVETINLAGGATTFTANHVYRDDDPTGTASDPHTVRASYGGFSETAGLTVHNAKPAVSEPILGTHGGVVNENSLVTVTGTYADVGVLDTHTVRIDWGDGTTSLASVDAAAKTYTATHRYVDDNPTGTPSDQYTIRAVATDDDGGSETSAAVTVMVNNVAPTLNAGADVTLNGEGQLNAAGAFADAGPADTFTGTVNYGDGTGTQPLSLNADGTFNLSHFYVPGVYTVTVTVTDDDGGTVTDTLTVRSTPKICVDDIWVWESNTSQTEGAATFTITLSAAFTQAVSVTVYTTDGTATSSSTSLGDYNGILQTRAQTITFSPGQTSRAVTIFLRGDTLVEPDETFFLVLTNPVNGEPEVIQAKATIRNDDLPATPLAGFTDDFEAPTLNPWWTASAAAGAVALSTEQARPPTGSQSVALTSDQTGDKSIRLSHNFAGPVYGRFSVWVYDTGAGQSNSNYLAMYLTNTAQNRSASILTMDHSGDFYHYGTPAPGGAQTTVARTPGWHQWTIEAQPTQTRWLIDGAVVHTMNTGVIPFDQVSLQMFGPAWRPSWEVFFDDFAFTPTAAAAVLSGVSYLDANGNGARDPGEAGIAGRTIYIDQDNDGVLDATETRTTTGPDGQWSITGVPSSFVTVREVEDKAYILTAPRQTFGSTAGGGRYTVLVSGNNVSGATGLDFGSFPSTITGTAGPDVIRARLDCCGGGYNFWVNTPETEEPTYSIPRSLVTQIMTINGGEGDDRVILDYSKGSLIPQGVTAAGQLIVNGQGGNDTLVLLGGARDEQLGFVPLATGQGRAGLLPASLATLSDIERLQADGGGGYDVIRHSLATELEVTGPQELSELRADGSSRIRLGPGAGILTSALTLAGSPGGWTSTLDLRGNALVLRSTAANRLADLTRVLDQVRSGRNGGAWNGTGIRTSTATPITTIAVALNERRDGTPLLPAFNGKTLDASAVIVKHTYHGDVNLNGRVEIDDYFAVDVARRLGGGGWTAGDFDDSGGRADAQDLMLMDRAFLAQSGAMGDAPATPPQADGRPEAGIQGVVWGAAPIAPEEEAAEPEDDEVGLLAGSEQVL